jgi:uncharacterized membrane protein YccC
VGARPWIKHVAYGLFITLLLATAFALMATVLFPNHVLLAGWLGIVAGGAVMGLRWPRE